MQVFYDLCKCFLFVQGFMIYASVFYLCKCFFPMSHRTNGAENFRYFQIFGKKDNLERLTGIFETKFSKYSVPFDFVPEFPEILA